MVCDGGGAASAQPSSERQHEELLHSRRCDHGVAAHPHRSVMDGAGDYQVESYVLLPMSAAGAGVEAGFGVRAAGAAASVIVILGVNCQWWWCRECAASQ